MYPINYALYETCPQKFPIRNNYYSDFKLNNNINGKNERQYSPISKINFQSFIKGEKILLNENNDYNS